MGCTCTPNIFFNLTFKIMHVLSDITFIISLYPDLFSPDLKCASIHIKQNTSGYTPFYRCKLYRCKKSNVK